MEDVAENYSEDDDCYSFYQDIDDDYELEVRF